MLLDGAFRALLLIICWVSSAAVPPPSNVTLRCQNLQTTVSWDYSKHQPQTVFWVNITGSKSVSPFKANTTEHQYDLSHFVLGSKEHYLTFLVVSVTAVQGGKQSEAVLSKSFSFDQLESVDIKCSLDFPPVTVHVAEQVASVKFQNPLRFYKELYRTVNFISNAVLIYTVSSAANTFEGKCLVTEITCKLDVMFPDNVEACVTLKGDLLFGNLGNDQVAFKETKKFCAEKQALYGEVELGVMLGSIFLIVLIVAVAAICKVEAWTTKIPYPLIQVDPRRNSEQQSFIPPVNPEHNKVSVSPPCKSSLLDSKGDNCPERPQASNTSCDYDHHPIQHYSERCIKGSNPNLGTGDLTSGANGTDDDSTDGSEKTECVSLSSTEGERSPYDCPHVHFQTELGDGEMVFGYSGN
ncbi:interferon gamma receptor 1 isoform 1-T2 [Anableps anableps]